MIFSHLVDSTLERGDLRGERGEAGSSRGKRPGGLRPSWPSSRVILLLDGSNRSRWRSLVGVTCELSHMMKGMIIDNKDENLILSMSRLGFSEQSGLLGSCKVPYGCQAHLSAFMEMV